MTRVMLALVLLGNGVAAGVMVSTVIGIVPMTLIMPYDRYIDTIRFLWPRYDPFMPVELAPWRRQLIIWRAAKRPRHIFR